MAQEGDDRRGRRAVRWCGCVVGGLMLALGAAIGVMVASGGDDSPAKTAAATAAPKLSDQQTIRFQRPVVPARTRSPSPTDAEGARTIEVSSDLPNGAFSKTSATATS